MRSQALNCKLRCILLSLCMFPFLSPYTMLDKYLEMFLIQTEICLVTSRNIPNTMYHSICAKTLSVFVKLNNNSTQTLSNYMVGRTDACACL